MHWLGLISIVFPIIFAFIMIICLVKTSQYYLYIGVNPHPIYINKYRRIFTVLLVERDMFCGWQRESTFVTQKKEQR